MPIMQTVIQGGGTTPTGTINITANGTYDVTDKASADVQVPTTAPASYRAFKLNMSNALVSSTSTPWIPLPAGTKDIGSYILYNAYKETPSNILNGTIDLSSLEYINGTYACYYTFYGCTGITAVNLSSLETIPAQHACDGFFGDCSGITNVNISSLISITGGYGCQQMFQGCTGITNIDMSLLTTVGGQYGCSAMFTGCRNLTTVNLCSLTKITGNKGLYSMFSSCTSLSTLSFPSLTPTSFGSYKTQFDSMLSGVTGCTVHFPNNIQSTISSWSSVTGGFGGTNTTVLFDLPATVTLTGANTVEYTRNPKYDTATSLAWKVGAYETTDFTPAYYTSGTINPSVSDTIYSDVACTTAVTTISSIA